MSTVGRAEALSMIRLSRLRERTYEVLEVGADGDAMSRTIDLLIMGLVFGNVLAVVLESVPSIGLAYQDLFVGFEQVSVAAFTTEFLLRLWSVGGTPEMGRTPTRRRLAYLRSPMAIVDVLAIAPFYLGTFFAVDLRFLRIMRLLRIVKLTRYSAALGRLGEVYRLQRAALAASFFVMSVAIVLSASVVYVVEHPSQPEAFGSIPAAMWWAVCTLTTVGYGDVTPITPLGKTLAAAIQLVGIAMVALPTSLFASGFAHIMARNEQTLEHEAREALADGIVTEQESDAYARLAEELYIEPDVAAEIIEAVQRQHAIEDLGTCPHCGKGLD